MNPMIHLVVIPNGMILAAYEHMRHAELHAQTVLGARVLSLPWLNDLPDTVRDDINSEDWDSEETPVQEPTSDITKTNPSTPRSKAKSRPPR